MHYVIQDMHRQYEDVVRYCDFFKDFQEMQMLVERNRATGGMHLLSIRYPRYI